MKHPLFTVVLLQMHSCQGNALLATKKGVLYLACCDAFNATIKLKRRISLRKWIWLVCILPLGKSGKISQRSQRSSWYLTAILSARLQEGDSSLGSASDNSVVIPHAQHISSICIEPGELLLWLSITYRLFEGVSRLILGINCIADQRMIGNLSLQVPFLY